MKGIKVYGIQRSGNNWLMWMLAANYKVKIFGNKYGYTHGPYNEDAREALPIVISKHPVEWLPSIHRFHEKHHGLSLSQFIRECDALERWNSLYAGHVANATEHGAKFIRYDDLLDSPERVLNKAVNNNFPRKQKPFRAAEDKKMSTRMLPTSASFDKQHYLKKQYMKHYTPELLEEVQNRIDWKVAESLGYRRMK